MESEDLKKEGRPVLEVKNLNAWFYETEVLHNIHMSFLPHQVVALIGPSGCGKSTFIRCLNRLHEEVDGAGVSGEVLLQGENIYAKGIDPVLVRRRIGMVFQKPNPFPGMSIFDNVSVGLRLQGIRKKSILADRVEEALRWSALWNEVKDQMKKPGTSLSGGQQQRLCIARALAVQPPVLLMDEPTSALDPISTAKIEELIQTLKTRVTIIIVTHNMQQAARISKKTAFFLSGNLIEEGKTSELFTNPKETKTEQYITGRFG